MNITEQKIAEIFVRKLEDSLDNYFKSNGFEQKTIMDKKKWEPAKAPNPYYK